MAINVQVNGQTISIPELGERNWGENVTDFCVEVGEILKNYRESGAVAATDGEIRLANGDEIMWRNAGNTANQRLYVSGTALYWQDGANPAVNLTSLANGNVTGPLSSTDNALVRFDGTGGQTIQNSSVIVDDSNAITGATELTIASRAFTDLVKGPASAVDNTVPRFDSTTGKLIQTSSVVIDDSNNVTGVADLTTSGAVVIGSIAALSANRVIDAATSPGTGTTASVRGVGLATSSGSFSTTSSSLVTITNQVVNLTSSGRPIEVKLVGASNGSVSTIGVQADYDTLTIGTAEFVILAGASALATFRLTFNAPGNLDGTIIEIPPGAICSVDAPSAGALTYTLQARLVSPTGGATLYVNNCRLMAKELL
jgi:hypothetical protein